MRQVIDAKYQRMSLVIKCIIYLFWTLKFFLLKFELSGLNTRHLGNKNETSLLEQATLYCHFCVINGQNPSYIIAKLRVLLVSSFSFSILWVQIEAQTSNLQYTIFPFRSNYTSIHSAIYSKTIPFSSEELDLEF